MGAVVEYASCTGVSGRAAIAMVRGRAEEEERRNRRGGGEKRKRGEERAKESDKRIRGTIAVAAVVLYSSMDRVVVRRI